MTAAADRQTGRDFTLVVDASGSMTAKDCPGGKSRWESIQESTLALARKVCEYDPDGITVYVFSRGFKRHDNVTEARVAEVFAEHEPMGQTILAPVLADIFNHWYDRKKHGTLKKGETVFVITDGSPGDGPAVASAICGITTKMDKDEELALSFLQIGQDGDATRYLKTLDDDLVARGAKFDIVDTLTFDELETRPLADVLAAAIDD